MLTWYAAHGRKDLPWQRPASPYRVWVSEVMLQQTQVATVIDYFERFVSRFPDVVTLAQASLDDVLSLWSGLGYYARGRNLHAAAREIVAAHAGVIPGDLDALQSLPGIGRSTAAAILSLSANRPHAILDGNVKRVLARYFAVDGWPGRSAVLRQLWSYAEDVLARDEAASYNQAMMDIGAKVCTRRAPRCGQCPLAGGCAALRRDAVHDYPGRKPARQLPVRSACMPMVRHPRGGVWLERRAATGRWGGLWSFPEFADEQAALAWAAQRFGADSHRRLPPFRHTFSHFHFDVQPLLVELDRDPLLVMDGPERVWYNGGEVPGGLPRPIEKLLQELEPAWPISCTA